MKYIKITIGILGIIFLFALIFVFCSSATSVNFGEYNSQNGYIRNLRTTWLASHSGTTGDSLETTRWFVSGMKYNTQYYCYRGYFFFDTSSIPDLAIIDSVSINYTVSAIEGAGCKIIYMCDTTSSTGNSPGISLATDDFYLTYYDKKLAETSTITTTGRKNDTLANFTSFINLTGITRFMAMDYAHDYLNSTPTGIDRIQVGDEENMRLWVTYHVFYSPSITINYPQNTSYSKDINGYWHMYNLLISKPTKINFTLTDLDSSNSWIRLRTNVTGSWTTIYSSLLIVNASYEIPVIYFNLTNKTTYWSINATDNISLYKNITNQFYIVYIKPTLSIYMHENIKNATGTHTYVLNSTGYNVYANYTGNRTTSLSIYLFEKIINATGTHTYILNSTGYKVYANYTGNESSFNSTSLNSSGSNWIYLGATLLLDNGQFFLLILIGLWSYFIYLFYKEKEVIFSFCIICCGLPLGIILSGVAYYNSYPFGYLISFILILISFLIPTYAMYKKNKKKN